MDTESTPESFDFHLEATIAVSPEVVRDFLSDLKNLASLHPLIASIEECASPLDSPNSTGYRVEDRIPIGPLHLRTVYRAALDRVSQDELHGYAWQRPGVRLHTVYSLTSVSSDEASPATRLDERVRVYAPWGLRGFVTRTARSAHQETLVRLKAFLEDPQP